MEAKRFRKTFGVSGFTLVELIVVITILVILGTIAFTSLQGTQKGARDSDRITTLALLQKGLDMSYITVWQYPSPEGVVLSGSVNGVVLAYVWEVQDSISKWAKLNKTPVDPLSNTYYAYWVDASGKYYQIATVLEDPSTVTYSPIVSTAYADNGYLARVIGNYKGLLVGGTKIYNLPSLVFTGSGDLSLSGVHFIVNKQANLPYQMGDQTNLTPKSTMEILDILTNGTTQVLTGVMIPKTMQEFTDTAEALSMLGYPLDTIGTKVLWSAYVPTQTETFESCLFGDGTTIGSPIGECGL